MKKIFNKFLSFFGFKKDKKTQKQTDEVISLISHQYDLLKEESKKTKGLTLSDLEALGFKSQETGFSVEELSALELAKRDELTRKYMKDKSADIINLNERIDKTSTPDEPVAMEVKNEILTFDRENQTFIPIEEEVTKKVLKKVNKRIDSIVDKHLKTKENNIEGVELVVKENKKELVKKTPTVKKSRAKSKPKTENKK